MADFVTSDPLAFRSLREANLLKWILGMTSTLSRMHYGEKKLASFELFQGLPDEAVETYSKQCLWQNHDAHQILIRAVSDRVESAGWGFPTGL
jgi:hypothetical protein